MALPRILFVGENDWANISNRLARALTSTGAADARALTLRPHAFGYREDLVCALDDPRVIEWVGSGVDWLVATGDEVAEPFDLALARFPHRHVGAMHVGSAYRSRAAACNARDVAIGVEARYVGAEMLHLADDCVPTFPTWAPVENWCEPGGYRPIRVLHSPSRRSAKGTDAVVAACDALGGPPVLVLEQQSHDVVAACMRESRVYFDQLNPAIGGFGLAAVEAAALGCGVVSDLSKVNRATYDPPFVRLIDPVDAKAAFAEAEQAAPDCYAWAREHYHPSRVVERLAPLLEGA